METAIEQIRSLSSNGTEATRKEIIDQLRELSYSLETQDDTLQRIMYTVCFNYGDRTGKIANLVGTPNCGRTCRYRSQDFWTACRK